MATGNEKGLTRRRFMTLAAAGAMAGAGALAFPGLARAGQIKLPPLPYSENALAPFISERTVSFHYGKHHAGYVKKTNALIKGTPYADMSLVEIVKNSAGKPADQNIFNNAAQVWNHTFYWNSMMPSGGGLPSGSLAAKLMTGFGSIEKFQQVFAKAAAGVFGSGWAWLVSDGGKLKVVTTGNAGTPLVHGLKPLICIDVWEHAYYLDYQNRRPAYIEAYLDRLVNWDFASKNLAS